MTGPYTTMLLNKRALATLGNFICLLLFSSLSYGLERDINCLRSIKDSLEDPLNYLNSSWNFNNSTEGFICRFVGIDCWHPDENRVLSIKLSNFGLKGEFPRGILNCSSLTSLDLSSNELYGNLPSDISKIIAFVTNLDLSSNQFSGNIPVGLANCSYLNTVKLDNNQFTGQIPPQLGLLGRIKAFSVANNRLIGPVPNFRNTSIPPESYANNPGLCGGPLPRCLAPSKKTHTGIIAGAAVGGFTIAAVGIALAMFFIRKSSRKKKDDDPEENKWARSIKGAKGIQLSLFEKSVSKLSLNDLMKASNNFSKDNTIGSGRTGTMYKALVNPVDTHLSTFVNGEFGDLGYVAPEYARTLVATPKVDVYSFGVVLLELVTRERPTYVAKAPENFKGSLVEWICQLSDEYKLKDALDECLVGKGYDSEIFQFLKVACSYVLSAPKERPTMFEVYQLLRAIGEKYNFTADDDLLMMPTESGDDTQLNELIVVREAKEGR